MSAQPIALPGSVLRLLDTIFPGRAVADVRRTVGGFSHLTVAVEIGGQPYVVKAADAPLKRADVRREAAVLTFLRGQSLHTPALAALAEDADWTVAVLEWLPGASGIGFYSQQTEALPPIASAIGALLARLHHAPLAPPADPDLSLARRAAQTRASLPALHLPADLHDLLAKSLAHPAWQETSALVHGDAGVHNILWDGQRIALLDWEWSGWGNPLLDLAWVAWTLRWRQAPDAVWASLRDSYGPPPGGWDEPARRALTLGHMAAILQRVQHLPDAKAEWERRIRWTIAAWQDGSVV